MLDTSVVCEQVSQKNGNISDLPSIGDAVDEENASNVIVMVTLGHQGDASYDSADNGNPYADIFQKCLYFLGR